MTKIKNKKTAIILPIAGLIFLGVGALSVSVVKPGYVHAVYSN